MGIHWGSPEAGSMRGFVGEAKMRFLDSCCFFYGTVGFCGLLFVQDGELRLGDTPQYLFNIFGTFKISTKPGPSTPYLLRKYV